MIEPWIALTLAAAAIQNVRSVLQKNLAREFTVIGITYARFLFACPLTLAFLAAAVAVTGAPPPAPSAPFFAYAVVGGVCQIVGNVIFIRLVGFANFTVSTTYAKTETVLAALFAFVVVGDVLSALGLLGVVLTFVGVVVLAAGRATLSLRALALAARQRAALYGLAVGATYAVASTCYRAGALSLGGEGFVLQALTTLAWVSAIQCLLMGLWIAVRAPAVLRTILRHWRKAAWVGLTGAAASACWYGAFAAEKAAYVLAVGQVELVFAYLASRFLYAERTTAAEFGGILLTVAGILAVTLAR
jgi:drug/metabolite transporter (DMT)-like permease